MKPESLFPCQQECPPRPGVLKPVLARLVGRDRLTASRLEDRHSRYSVPLSIDDLAFQRSQLLKLDDGKHRRLLSGGRPVRDVRRESLGPDNQPIGRARQQPTGGLE